MNEREHAVLSLFYEEGHHEITPSLLAYRMRMSTGDATKLLDGMVKKDLLNLNVDDEGHIGYRLPPSERHRIASRPPGDSDGQTPRSDDQTTSRGDDTAGQYYRAAPRERTSAPNPNQTRNQTATAPADGTDAAPGYGSAGPAHQGATRRHGGHDGTDGSIGPTGPVSGSMNFTAEPTGPVQGDWYEERPHTGPNPRDWNDPRYRNHNGAHSRQGPPPQGAPQHHPPGPDGHSRRTTTAERPQNPSAEQFQQQLREDFQRSRNLPARTDDQHPAHHHAGPRRGRIPILAGALSLLIPGLGQFYNGEISKGVMLLFSYVFLIMFWLFWIVHIWSIIDAYMVAEQSNQQGLPDDQDPSNRPLLTEHPHQNSNPNSTAA